MAWLGNDHHITICTFCDDRHITICTFCDDRHIGARKDALYLDRLQPQGDGTMSWLKITISAIDYADILEGLLIVVPFIMIFTIPFLPFLIF